VCVDGLLDQIARMGIRVGDLAFPAKFEEKLTALVNYYKRIFPDMAPVDIPKEVAKYTQDYYGRIKPLIVDTVHYLSQAIKTGKRVMVEGSSLSPTCVVCVVCAPA
jgi:adenylosuccinate synthase